MGGVQLEAQTLSRQLAGSVAVHRKRIGYRGSEQGIAKGGEHQPQRRLSDVMFLVADAKLRHQVPDRIQDRVQRVTVAGQDHPRGKSPGAFPTEGVESAVDDFARVCLSGSGASYGFGNASGHPVGNRAGELGLQSRRRAERVPEVGVGSPDFGGHCLQRYGLWALFKQELPSSLQCGGSALLGVEALAAY